MEPLHTPPPRSNASRTGLYPVREADGLLFVFPSCDADADAEASRVPLPLIAELHDPALEGRWKWKIPAGVRDFPCSWDGMVENTLDPAHFCSAHHGTLGNRYEDPKPYQMAITRQITADNGFAIDGALGRLEFQPPCLVKYMPNFAAMPFEGNLVIATYCVPTRPGWVRPLANVLLDSEATLGWTLAEQALSVFVNYPLPPWVGHVLSSVVLHQDAGLLYGQSRNLRERGYNFARAPGGGVARESGSSGISTESDDIGAARDGRDGLRAGWDGMDGRDGLSGTAAEPGGKLDTPAKYESLTFCPTPSDKGVLTFRRWLREHGGEGIPWDCDDSLPARGTEDLYDMWDAHTKHCSQCRAALQKLDFLKGMSLVLFAMSLAALPHGTERTLTALGLLAMVAALQYVGGLFYRYEYSHADEYGPLDWYLDLADRRR